jgi:hypothetical protein
MVHALLSEHFFGWYWHPKVGWQLSSVQMLLSSQFLCWEKSHAPFTHFPMVHKLLSLQTTPLKTHLLDSASQVSTVHGFPSSHPWGTPGQAWSCPVEGSHWNAFLLRHLPVGIWRQRWDNNLKHKASPLHFADSEAQFSETNLGITWHPFAGSQ